MASLNRTFRWIAAGIALVVVAGVAVSLTLQALLDADYIERRLNEALDRSTEGSYRVEVGAVQWSLWRRALRADRLSLHPDSQALRRQQETERRPARWGRATIGTVQLQGIQVWPLLWNRALRLETLVVRQPHVHVTAHDSARQRADNGEGASTTADRSAYVVHEALARQLPEIAVRQLRVHEGALSIQRQRGRAADTLWGLSTRVNDLTIDSASARDTSRVLFSDEVTVAFDGYRRVFNDSLYAFAVGPTRASTADASLTVEALQLAPTVSDRAFMRRQDDRTNRFRSAARQVALQGVDYRRFIEERALVMRAAQIDSLVVDVYRNNHLPPDADGAPPKMPHEAFRALQRAVRIDTIRVSDGHIRYAELAEKGTQPGAISFENVFASIYNVTNDADRMTPATPVVIDATTRVAGAGRLQTTIRLPLLTPHLSVSYQGHLGPMDARAFNETFVNLAGIRIESGHVDSLRFEAKAQRGVATGTLRGVYRNLEVETLDKATGDRGVGERIKTLFLNNIALESSNLPASDTLRGVSIDHTHKEGHSFFKFLWLSVRSGLFSLIGV